MLSKEQGAYRLMLQQLMRKDRREEIMEVKVDMEVRVDVEVKVDMGGREAEAVVEEVVEEAEVEAVAQEALVVEEIMVHLVHKLEFNH